MSARSLGKMLGFLPGNSVSYRKGNFNGRVNCPDKNYIVASQHMYCLSTEFWSLCTGLIKPILVSCEWKFNFRDFVQSGGECTTHDVFNLAIARIWPTKLHMCFHWGKNINW